MRRWLKQHPFLILGVGTLLLFAAVETLRAFGAVEASLRLALPMRVLIIPMYLVWLGLAVLGVTVAGADGLAGPLGTLFWGTQLLCGLAPYIAGDYLLRRWRDAHSGRHRAA